MILVWREPCGRFTASVRAKGIQCTIYRETCPLKAAADALRDWVDEFMIRYWSGFDPKRRLASPASAADTAVARSATPRAKTARGPFRGPGLFGRGSDGPPTVIRGAN